MNAIVSSQRHVDRRFYLGGSLVFVVLMCWAFARTYYLKLLFGTPALTPWVHLHGMVMTGWVVLLVVQTSLVVAHRVRWHRRLGTVGVAWALGVVILGSTTTFHGAAREVHEHSPGAMVQVSVLGLELLQMLLFATLVVLAVWLRRRTDYHKRLMLLTLACMLPLVISRLPFIHGFDAIFWGFAVVVIAGVSVDTIRNRRLHPVFGWGAATILATIGIAVIASTTPWWLALGTSLVS